MNRKILLLIGIFVMLSGCGSSISQEDYDAKVSELETLQKDYDAKVAELEDTQKELDKLKADNKEESDSETALKSPVSFNEMSKEERSKVSNGEGFTQAVAYTLADIGVSDINDIHFGNYEYPENDNLSTCFLDATCNTENNTKLIIRGMSMLVAGEAEEWSVISVRNQESGIYYYVPEDSKKYTDLYDYKTGDLISAKSEDITSANIVEDFNKKMDEISQKADENFDKILEKYGVK